MSMCSHKKHGKLSGLGLSPVVPLVKRPKEASRAYLSLTSRREKLLLNQRMMSFDVRNANSVVLRRPRSSLSASLPRRKPQVRADPKNSSFLKRKWSKTPAKFDQLQKQKKHFSAKNSRGFHHEWNNLEHFLLRGHVPGMRCCNMCECHEISGSK